MSVEKWIAVSAGPDTIKLIPMEGAGPDFFVKLTAFDELHHALADIAFSKDMTLEVAQAKAKRIYERYAGKANEQRS